MAVPMVEAMTARRSWIWCSDADIGPAVISVAAMGGSWDVSYRVAGGDVGRRAPQGVVRILEGTRIRRREFPYVAACRPIFCRAALRYCTLPIARTVSSVFLLSASHQGRNSSRSR